MQRLGIADAGLQLRLDYVMARCTRLARRLTSSSRNSLARKANPMAATLSLRPEQRELLAQALADAVLYCHPPVHCPACASDTLCEQCAAGLARARADRQPSGNAPSELTG